METHKLEESPETYGQEPRRFQRSYVLQFHLHDILRTPVAATGYEAVVGGGTGGDGTVPHPNGIDGIS